MTKERSLQHISFFLNTEDLPYHERQYLNGLAARISLGFTLNNADSIAMMKLSQRFLKAQSHLKLVN